MTPLRVYLFWVFVALLLLLLLPPLLPSSSPFSFLFSAELSAAGGGGARPVADDNAERPVAPCILSYLL